MGPPSRREFEKHRNSLLDKHSRFEQGLGKDPRFEAKYFVLLMQSITVSNCFKSDVNVSFDSPN